jgi:hypothetical protein
MANKSKQYPIPKFSNLDEEDKFWQYHSPLMEGYKGKAQKKKQNRASFLSVRLTGDELASLREKATRYGLGPSTYARQILIQAMESGERHLPPELLFIISTSLGKFLGNKQEEYFKKINDIYNEYQKVQNSFANEITSLCYPNVLEQMAKHEQLERQNVKK